MWLRLVDNAFWGCSSEPTRPLGLRNQELSLWDLVHKESVWDINDFKIVNDFSSICWDVINICVCLLKAFLDDWMHSLPVSLFEERHRARMISHSPLNNEKSLLWLRPSPAPSTPAPYTLGLLPLLNHCSFCHRAPISLVINFFWDMLLLSLELASSTSI